MRKNIIEKNLDIIGHFHAAEIPGRHELFNSEVNYPFVITRIEEMGYKGYFGLEYFFDGMEVLVPGYFAARGCCQRRLALTL